MRKALVVGIDYYTHCGVLSGCVNDADSVTGVLGRHGDGSPNFGVRSLHGTDASRMIAREELADAVRELFDGDSEIALFYFAGHGAVGAAGTYLLTSEARREDAGVPLNDILSLANKSRARSKVILLDSCHSGAAGTPHLNTTAELSEGLTILTASTSEQYASEENGQGVFTSLLVDALSGSAANLTGDITPGAVYAHIDQSLGEWDQRPVFKTNVKNFVSLRRVAPSISPTDLRRITEFFPTRDHEFPLDPSFEPEEKGRTHGMPSPNPENTRTFAILQKYSRVDLLVPVGAQHMWHAAMESRTCKLTRLGEHYRQLAKRGRI